MSNELFYTEFVSSIGTIFLYAKKKSIIALDFKSNSSYSSALNNPNLPILKSATKELEEYFAGKRRKFTIKLEPSGTIFQKMAWSALLEIPYGKTKSYKEQAEMLNKPKAFRAVGSANGKNPIPIIIPCHRIVTFDGKLGGYSGDILLKQKLLKLEGHFFKI
jgi:methylated-DNA-[protein]-cysteine S-methyltransferase